MRRQLSATLIPLAATMCGVFAGSAAASIYPNLPVTGYPPQVGVTVNATIQDSVDDQINWVTCDSAGDIGATLLLSSASYTLAQTDSGTDVCAVETPINLPALILYESSPIGPVGPVPTIDSPGPVQESDKLTVTQGAWGSGVVPTDVWEDCDARGANCAPVASSATGISYAAARSDVGSTIEVFESEAPGSTPSVPSAPTSVVSATPPVLDTANPPTLSGTPQVGDTLTVSHGAWSNNPTSYTYQWKLCSTGCTAIHGATSSTYVPVAADGGHTLDVYVAGVVDAGAPYGSAGTAFPSNPLYVPGISSSSSSTSSSPPPVSPTSTSTVAPVVAVTDPQTPKALGRLTAMMRWTFRYAPSYTQVVALGVENPAVASTIATRCSGGGCPFKIHRFRVRELKRCRSHTTGKCRAPHSVSLESEFHTHKLAVGTQVTVEITRSRDVGKYYRFIIRRRRAPRVKISCLAPGSSTPGRDCTAR